MAKPRRRSFGAKFAYGLGQGIQQASDTLMKQALADRQNDRIMERQAASEFNRYLTGLQESVAKGETTPEQAAQSLTLKTGRTIEPGMFRGLQPPLMQRRAMQPIGEQILRADTPAEVPDVNTMFRAASEAGSPNVAGLMDMASRGGIDLESLLAEAPLDVQAATRGATVKRRALTEQPTEIATVTTPQGTFQQPVSKFNMNAPPLQTAPAPFVKGQMAGQEQLGEFATVSPELLGSRAATQERALLEGVGPARAAQAGAETTARGTAQFGVDRARAGFDVSQAARTAGAQAAARLPYEINLATERARIELQAALTKDNEMNVMQSSRVAGQLTPFLQKAAEITDRLNVYEGTTARVMGGVERGKQMLGMSTDVTALDNLISQYARQWAMAMGVREANVSERETEQALKGIGLSASATRTERNNALNSLTDLATLAPVVAARLGPDATITERMALASKLATERATARDAALQQPQAKGYYDPVTNAVLPLYR